MSSSHSLNKIQDTDFIIVIYLFCTDIFHKLVFQVQQFQQYRNCNSYYFAALFHFEPAWRTKGSFQIKQGLKVAKEDHKADRHDSC